MLPLLCFQNLGPNSCFPPSQSRDCIVETPLNALFASWQNLSPDLERVNDPSTNKSQSKTVLPIPRRVLSPKHIIFNTIKPLLVLKSSPSRTNTNLNTLHAPSQNPLNTAFMSPIPQNPSIPPNLLSHNRKSSGASAMAPARLRSLVGRAQRPFFASKVQEQ